MMEEISPRREEEAADDKENVKLAAAKLVTLLNRREQGTLEVEKSSVYGAALAIPQVARSAGWPREMITCALKAYGFLFLALSVQLCLLYLINKEMIGWSRFAGKMYLCDFGANMEECPDGPGCTGPGGTQYEPSLLYNYDSWASRKFIADSLKAVFPDEWSKAAEIPTSGVQPGEFGVESPKCRYMACFLFIIALIPELMGCWNMMMILCLLPNKDESWLDYEPPTWAPKEEVKKIRGLSSEIDLVSLKIAGMSLPWKIVNFWILLVPKVVILCLTLAAGSTFLMETSGIDNIIVNSTALAFILNIDEMIFEGLLSRSSHYIVDRIDGFPLYDDEIDETLTDGEVMKLYQKRHQMSSSNLLSQIMLMVPFRLILACAVCALGIWGYYMNNCMQTGDGVWVSKAMHLPIGVEIEWWQALFPRLFPVPSKVDPYWKMPPLPAKS